MVDEAYLGTIKIKWTVYPETGKGLISIIMEGQFPPGFEPEIFERDLEPVICKHFPIKIQRREKSSG